MPAAAFIGGLQLARFIRGKVKNGEYTKLSEVVRDAVRRMQEIEASKSARIRLADFEPSIRRGVRQGIKDYEEYDADGLRNLAEDLVAKSAKKLASRTTAKMRFRLPVGRDRIPRADSQSAQTCRLANTEACSKNRDSARVPRSARSSQVLKRRPLP